MVRSLCVLVSSAAISAGALADSIPECSTVHVEVPVKRVVASAGLLANLFRLDGSVRSQSARLVREAEEQRARAVPPRDACPLSCAPAGPPEIVIRSTPRKERADHRGAERCDELLEQTLREPLRFGRRALDSLDALDDWVEDFTRGRNPDGEELYRRCDGGCSPRYTWVLSLEAERVLVETEVVCGRARDRDDGEFELSAELRWTCTRQGPG